MLKRWCPSLSLLALLLAPYLMAASAQAQIQGGTSWNSKKRITTVTIHGLPRFTKLQLFVPSYTYRTKGKTDACKILTVNVGKDFPLRPGDLGWQWGYAGGKAFYWSGNGHLDDHSSLEPKCVNGQLQNVPADSWRVWADTSKGLLRYYDVNSGYQPNTEYATVLRGDLYGPMAGPYANLSGRSLLRTLKTNTCGTLKFNILEYWDDDLSTGMGRAYSYVDGYQIRNEAGSVLFQFNPANLWESQGAVCRKGRLYTPRP
jgi:hypothetical protein